MEAEYLAEGEVKVSWLLLSGFWGVSRHMNYTFELFLAFAWILPAINLSPLPFLYVLFLVILAMTVRSDGDSRRT